MRRTEHEIADQIRGFIKDTFLYMRPDFVLGDEDRLLQQGIIDSMGVLELIQFLTDDFGVELADDEISEANLGSVGAVARFVVQKQNSVTPT